MTERTPLTTRPRWPDRTFRFGHPDWMVADFAERLRGTVHRLRALFDGVPDALVREQVGGTWSMLQNAGHLGDVEELWLRRVDDLRAGRRSFTPADPARFADLAEAHQARGVSETLEYVGACRAPFLEVLESADDALLRATAHHDRLDTPMRLVDMAQFAAEHDDHHLLRIRELRRRRDPHRTQKSGRRQSPPAFRVAPPGIEPGLS